MICLESGELLFYELFLSFIRSRYSRPFCLLILCRLLRERVRFVEVANQLLKLFNHEILLLSGPLYPTTFPCRIRYSNPYRPGFLIICSKYSNFRIFIVFAISGSLLHCLENFLVCFSFSSGVPLVTYDLHLLKPINSEIR